jgi:hypothetical protein
MDLIEGGTISLRKANRHWKIPLTSLTNDLYGKKTFRKHGSTCVLIEEKYQVLVV